MPSARPLDGRLKGGHEELEKERRERTMRSTLAVTTALLLIGGAAAQDIWYPSRYGAEDTIGALNNLSPEATKAAAGLVQTGKVYALGVVTNRQSPAYA